MLQDRPLTGERARLAALARLGVMDTLPEPELDRITRLASRMFSTPIALISLLDGARAWFKSRIGFDVPETPRDISFCTHVVEGGATFVVNDAAHDPQFATHPLVAGAPAIRFYAGAPLVTRQGYAVGTLCVIDTKPRGQFGDTEQQMLEDLAQIVMDKLELASQARMIEMIVETAVDAIVTTGQDGIVRSFNRAAAQMFGYAPNEVIGRNIGMLMAAGDAAGHDRSMQRYLSGGQARIIGTGREVAGRRRDGSVFPLFLSLSEVVQDGERQFTGIMRDLSAQKAAEAALEQARRDLQVAVDAGPGALLRTRIYPDRAPVYHFISAAIERVTGYTAQEAMAPGWLEQITDPACLPVLTESRRKSMALEESETLLRYRAKNGDWRWMHAVVRPQQIMPDGSADVVVYAMDVTVQQQQQARMLHTAKLATLGEMTTSMAHELNQPLAIISMAAQNAKYEVRSPERYDSLEARLDRIQAQALRASKLIEHLRVFGRSGEMGLAEISLDDVVTGTLVLGGVRLHNSGVTLNKDIPAGLPRVMGNTLLLEQVLLNLIANACDAYDTNPAERHDPSRTLTFAARAEGASVVLSVADRAGGIPEANLGRVFEPFFTTKQASKGTGVGLSFCYGVVTDMHGSMSVRNEGGGAVFEIALPAAG